MIAAVSLNSCLDRTLESPGFAAGAHCQAQLLGEQPAGKGMNLARLLVARGADARLYGFVGHDAADRFHARLQEAGVENRLQALPLRTRMNTTLVDPEGGRETHIRERGEPVPAGAIDTLGARLSAELATGDWVVFAGSLPPGIRPAAFADLVGRLADAGLSVAVDAAGEALRRSVLAGARLIKPNRDELAGLLGARSIERLGIPAAFRRFAAEAERPDLEALVSDGARGAILLLPEAGWQARANGPVAVQNTVGAGDALLAGYLAALTSGQPPEACLQVAIQVATASLARVHAGELDPGCLSTPVVALAL